MRLGAAPGALLAGVLFATILLGSSRPAQAAFPGRNGLIAFERGQSGGTSIFTMRPDGSGLDRLTRRGAINESPAFSPDGRRIAFTRQNASGRIDVAVMRADGSDAHRVTRRPHNEFSPAFSPSGAKLVFAGDSAGDLEVFTIRTDGSHLRQVTHNGVDDLDPVFSPRGDRIAFTRSDPPQVFGQIYTIRPDGTHSRQVTHSPNHVNNVFPDFSPGGGTIAFDRRSFRRKPNGIFTIGIHGDDERQVTSPARGQHLEPAFAPSGRRLAYTSVSATGRFNIATMRLDGSHRHRLTHDADSLLPDWQPLPR